MEHQDPRYEPMPDHYGTGREPYRKKSFFTVTLLLLALLVGANIVSAAFLMGYRVGKQQSESVTPSVAASAPTAAHRKPLADNLADRLQPSLARIQTESGSYMGILLSSDGYLLAAVPGADRLLQVSIDGKTYTDIRAEAAAPELGLRVIQIDAQGLQPVAIGLYGVLSAPEVELVRYFQPLEGRDSLEWGIHTTQTERLVAGIQCRVLEGSYEAGDLLLNDLGQLIALCVPTEDGVLALPAEELINLSLELMAFGCLHSPLSPGLEISLLDEAQSLYWDLPGNVMIRRIREGSSAQAAGLREGDVLLEIAGIRIENPTDLWSAISACKELRSITLKVYRGSEELELALTLD